MSDILIKGMEMPKERPVCIVIDVAGQARRYDLNNDRYADDKLFEAVPVPPHGRLKDVDAVSLEGGPYEYDEWCKWALEQYQDAPTIIPAEEGNDG